MPFDAMSFDPRTSFGPGVAAGYDAAPRGDEEAAVARLAALAGGGPVLELAVGTGRDGVDQYVFTEHIDADGVLVEVGRFDRVSQRVDKCHVRLAPGGTTLDPLALRYVWPSELDLMARLAGLRLRARWGGWADEPFDARSLRHVSVYGR